MRSFIILAMFLASIAGAAANDYTETRDLSIAADGLGMLVIDVGAGSLDVQGVAGLDMIEVTATIVIPDADSEDGRKIVEKELKLTLQRDGDSAVLKSLFEKGFWGSGSDGYVDVEVRAPASIAVDIDDGSGSLDVKGFVSNVRIDDGSGSIDVDTAGGLDIDDGSGSIDVVNVSNDVYINDGSGSITVEKIGGTVTIDDGSGSIRVNDVSKDLIILDAGSGSVSFSDVRGIVEEDS
jgi:hypothetical protein